MDVAARASDAAPRPGPRGADAEDAGDGGVAAPGPGGAEGGPGPRHGGGLDDGDSSSDSDDGDAWLARLGGPPGDSDEGDDEEEDGAGPRDVAGLFAESEAQRSRRVNALEKRERSAVSRKMLRRIPDSGLALKAAAGKVLHVDEVVGVQNRMLWDCAGVLASFLDQRPEIVCGRRVVELGCALGLPGITAAALGARRVLLTERPSALPWIRHQIELNGASLGEQAHVEAATIEWDRELPAHAIAEGAFDVVLCSDLIYAGDARTTEALVRTIAALTCDNPDAVVISCFEVRDVPASAQDQTISSGSAMTNSSQAQEQLFARLLARDAGFLHESAVPALDLADGFRDDDILIKLHHRRAPQ